MKTALAILILSVPTPALTAQGPATQSQLQLCLLQAQELCEDAWLPYVTTECHEDDCHPELIEGICRTAATNACLDRAVGKNKLWKRR